MDKVFVITEGSYSDYSILAVFSTREKAENAHKVISKRVSDINEIEEYPLDDFPSVGKRWEVDIDMTTGNIISESETESTVWSSEAISYVRYLCDMNVIRATSSRGRDVAYKAALDKRNQMQAEQEGIA